MYDEQITNQVNPNFADKLRALGQYSLLAEQEPHSLFWFVCTQLEGTALVLTPRNSKSTIPVNPDNRDSRSHPLEELLQRGRFQRLAKDWTAVGSEFESRLDKNVYFSVSCIPALELKQPPIHLVPVTLNQGVKGPRREAIQSQLTGVNKTWTYKFISTCAFMEWCLLS